MKQYYKDTEKTLATTAAANDDGNHDSKEDNSPKNDQHDHPPEQRRRDAVRLEATVMVLLGQMELGTVLTALSVALHTDFEADLLRTPAANLNIL